MRLVASVLSVQLKTKIFLKSRKSRLYELEFSYLNSLSVIMKGWEYAQLSFLIPEVEIAIFIMNIYSSLMVCFIMNLELGTVSQTASILTELILSWEGCTNKSLLNVHFMLDTLLNVLYISGRWENCSPLSPNALSS